MHLIDVHLLGIHIRDGHLRGGHVKGMHLIGVYLIGAGEEPARSMVGVTPSKVRGRTPFPGLYKKRIPDKKPLFWEFKTVFTIKYKTGPE